MEILYFARLRETIGHSCETRDLPADIISVADLIDHLTTQGPQYVAAFENMDVIRVAVDQAYVGLDHSLEGCREVAFFPPMTGG
ncbi:molybdopterin converting factor subunit 1 [Paremcibacter congregatus]|uniref:Molybdopterin converting factor subunit 1 n=1 Tax=Paremcibacter congregatus TaxID=2043170 RepID=A0A2G4YN79_9PROT|nr:molybdopterin converting factor subunit 1 [Paremcibacter congregatus]PHZ83770.1 molybdopterin converting factor subunit 1 [Paremcibacter congregatus]QDE27472.1 molybdopterin converting factor subunit 1 [Paremcibacter congregatus]